MTPEEQAESLLPCKCFKFMYTSAGTHDLLCPGQYRSAVAAILRSHAEQLAIRDEQIAVRDAALDEAIGHCEMLSSVAYELAKTEHDQFDKAMCKARAYTADIIGDQLRKARTALANGGK